MTRTAPRRYAASIRTYKTTSILRLAYKDSQDRESLKPASSEHTKSGRDDIVSKEPEAAFSRDKPSPDDAKRAAGKGNESNPLEVSGANQKLSKPMGDEKSIQKTGAGKETKKGEGKSKAHSSEKKGRT